MANPSRSRPQSPRDNEGLKTLNHQSADSHIEEDANRYAHIINHEASEPPALAPILCATIGFLIALGSPNLSALYGPEAYLRLSDTGVLLLDDSSETVGEPHSHAMSVEDQQRIDPFDGVLGAVLDAGPSRSEYNIVDLISSSPSPARTIYHHALQKEQAQTWIDRATTPDGLKQDLLRCLQDIQP